MRSLWCAKCSEKSQHTTTKWRNAACAQAEHTCCDPEQCCVRTVWVRCHVTHSRLKPEGPRISRRMFSKYQIAAWMMTYYFQQCKRIDSRRRPTIEDVVLYGQIIRTLADARIHQGKKLKNVTVGLPHSVPKTFTKGHRFLQSRWNSQCLRHGGDLRDPDGLLPLQETQRQDYVDSVDARPSLKNCRWSSTCCGMKSA